MSRKLARNELFKLVFEICFQDHSEVLFDEFLENENISAENKDFVKEIYSGIMENKESILEDISKYLKGYTVERLFKVDLSILMIAFYEIKYQKVEDYKVVVNEAVELAKKYSTPKSYSFINGVIASLIKDIN
jgi:N utilization substance protein B